jgi:hypothetical protein
MPLESNYSLPAMFILTKMRSEFELPEIIKRETDIGWPEKICN